jgi:hypothetical protein
MKVAMVVVSAVATIWFATMLAHAVNEAFIAIAGRL